MPEIELQKSAGNQNAALKIENLAKSFDSKTILEGISSLVKKGEIFGFFGAFGGYGSDERVERNMNRSGKNAFIFATLATSFSFAYLGIFKGVETYHPLLVIPFAGSILLFVFSYAYYDKKGEA